MRNILATGRHAEANICLPASFTSSKSCPGASEVKAAHVSGASNPKPMGHMQPRMAMNEA